MRSVLILGTLWLLALADSTLSAGPAFPLQAGDRIVLIGDGLIERAQQYGYLETELLSRFPRTKVTFRNLGWNGDTVRGLSRGYFDGPETAEKRQTEQVAGEKPTVLIVGYGMAESFDGLGKLPEFQQGLETFLDRISDKSQRVVLLSPIPHEDLGPPLPDPTEHNTALAAYSQAIAEVAKHRSATFVDLFERLSSDALTKGQAKLTDNGIHLSAAGYRQTALEIMQDLELPAEQIQVGINIGAVDVKQEATRVKLLKASPTSLKYQQTDTRLPTPPLASSAGMHPQETALHLQVTGLKTGKYELQSEGRSLGQFTSEQLSQGVQLSDTPQHRQAEKLRQLVVRKNQLFFAKYRPQNITYLLGFRRHEQGQNAKELEELAQMVGKLETEIDAARIPATYTFELKPAAK